MRHLSRRAWRALTWISIATTFLGTAMLIVGAVRHLPLVGTGFALLLLGMAAVFIVLFVGVQRTHPARSVRKRAHHSPSDTQTPPPTDSEEQPGT